jgi:putative ABC transport system permease protein
VKRRVLGALGVLGGAAASCVLLLIRAAARLLSTTRIGRLLSAVSIPRMQDHRLRTSLTVLGVGLGVAVLVAVGIVNDSVLRGVTATVDDIAGKTDLSVSAGTDGFDEAALDRVRAAPGVTKAVPLNQQTVTVADPRLPGERLLVLGVDMLADDDQSFRSYGSSELDEIRKDPVAFLNSPQNLLLSRTVARRFGYRLHDKIPLTTARGVQEFEIWGFLDDRGVGRAFGGSVAVMYYQGMQVAFDRGHNIDRIDIAVDDRSRVAAVEAQLSAEFGSGFAVERPERKGERVSKMLLGVRSGLTSSSLIALLVGAFLIHNTMSISVVQRKREIGILRALGSKRGEIVLLLTLEGALLGAVGSLLGLAIGVALSRGLLTATRTALNQTYLQLAASEIAIDPRLLAAGFGLGTLAATLASAVPARVAAANRPAETLRTAALVRAAPYPLRPTLIDALALALIGGAFALLRLPAVGGVALSAFVASFALMLAGALLVPRLIQVLERLLRPIADRLLGVEARLANQNLPRDIGRTATTAGALMCGVALAISFGIFTHSFATTLDAWVDQTLPGDLFITQGASMGGTSMRNVPMADQWYEPLRALPDVETVRRVRIVELPYAGSTIKTISTDIRIFLRHARLSLREGRVDQVADALERGQVMVSENFARHFGVHAGSDVELSTHEGTRKFRVIAVAIDYTSDVGSVMFDRAQYIAEFRDSRVDTYELHLQPGADTERARRAVNALFGEARDLFVLTNREFKREISHTTDQIFSLVRVLELVALIVAVLGIVNAQLANVLDRVREIGTLRALGMLRRQARRMIVIEATLTGVIGIVAGLLLGMALGYLLLEHINLVQTGWYFPYRLSPRALLEVTVLTLPAAALAGLYAAREAANLVVSDALEYE